MVTAIGRYDCSAYVIPIMQLHRWWLAQVRYRPQFIRYIRITGITDVYNNNMSVIDKRCCAIDKGLINRPRRPRM